MDISVLFDLLLKFELVLKGDSGPVLGDKGSWLISLPEEIDYKFSSSISISA